MKHWAPLEFDKTCSLSYLLVRTPGEYAVLSRILQEIKAQDPNYRPMTLFDFGSGLCTAYWAASHTYGKLSEVFCVDTSTAMNDIARNIILKGEENGQLPTGMTFR